MKYQSIWLFLFMSWLLFIMIMIACVSRIFNFTAPKKSGSTGIKMRWDEYGFGEDKRLVVINLTDIGSVDNIHPADKRFATITWGDKDGFSTSTIGIELKGGIELPKKNLAFEFWEAAENDIPCTSPETCDDDKVELYDFDEKYEDYVLRSDYKEQTFIRDALAPRLTGGIMQSKNIEPTILVEVLFVFGDKYTYEGVYLLMPAIQRRLIEKMKWDSKGKAEDCDDDDYNINKVGVILEYTVDSADSGGLKECAVFKSQSVKMRYPKCSFYDEPDVASCRKDYISKTEHYIDKLHASGDAVIDLESFANTYLLEMLMRDGDFPKDSQYFYVNPDNQIMFSGPRWDYDSRFWATLDDNSWDIEPHKIYWQDTVMPLWKVLGTQNTFIQLVKSKKNTVQTNLNITLELISKRQQQYEAGYFDREIERWGKFGESKSTDDNFQSFLYGGAVHSKESFESELTFIKKYFMDRSEWMLNNIDNFNGFKTIEGVPYYIILVLSTWYIWLMGLLVTGLSIYACAVLKPDQSSKQVYKPNSSGYRKNPEQSEIVF